LLRRTKEFDKPDLISNAFYGISPGFHATQVTGDVWRYQRKLIQDLMTPAFLNEVAAPQLHDNFMDLVNLWSEKMQLGKGRPFEVKKDIYNIGLEAIWAALFGIEGIATVTRNNIELLSNKDTLVLPTSTDEEVVFPQASAPPAFQAIFELTDSIEWVLKSPFPKVTGFIQRYLPHGWKNMKLKKKFVIEEISKAEERQKAHQGKETKITNAMDHILRRENMAAEKLQRAPIYYSQNLIDEVGIPTSPYNIRRSSQLLITSPDLRPPHRRPRHHFHNPNLGLQIPRRLPTRASQTPHRLTRHLRHRSLL
jgi:hypothetical protein